MRKLLLLLLIILLVPFVFADISLESKPQQIYNLGDQLILSFTVQESAADAIFKVNLDCSPYALNYFTNLISLEDNVSLTIPVPNLKISKDMLGACKLKAFLTSFDKETIAKFESDEFLITDELKISFELERTEFLPGESVLISSDAGVNVMVFFQNQELNFNPDEEITFTLETAIASGSQEVILIAEDEFGNKVEKTVGFVVLPVPTLLEISLAKSDFLPGESVKITVSLLDQAGAQISDKDLNFKLGEDIISTTIKANNPVSFDLPEFLSPETYTIIASYEEISAETPITIQEVKELEIVFQDNLAYVKNIGNIDYNEDVDFNLEGENSRTVTKKIRLDPDETTIIDLSKEVPEGSYEVSSPETEATAEVELEDNRNIVKKTSQGLGSITGAVISEGNNVSFAPFIFIGLLVVVIFGFVFFRKKKKVSI